MYDKKLEDALAREWEMHKKESEELYVVCENSVTCIKSVLC